MSAPLDILKQYWGYSSFRPLQLGIVEAVAEGKDVLALLPTGGGKSICFQVPALMKEGICIVVSPLIALMKDQVGQLRERGIHAVAIYSGMSRKEIDIQLDNCVYGNIKFLYVSPERLKTDLFKERARKMNVALLAIDEAHCISQWGYDFRPAYLEIAGLREVLPEVNCIALTATATEEVQKDIKEKLRFPTEARHFQKSFARGNLSYSVREAEDKEQKLLEIVKNVAGPAIVYAATRKRTKSIARLLFKNNISADFYHAGLAFEQRMKKQDAWIKNQVRVMVATNAFGMGIDKPDVRLVVHMDIPGTLESYYQEAGRAGRDEKKAYAVIVYQENDLKDLRQKQELENPPIDFIKRIYQALANYYKLAVGSGEGQSFDFDVNAFAEVYGFDGLQVYYALKKIENDGFIQLNEAFYNPSQIHIVLNNNELYKFQIANAKYDLLIKGLLRLYGGEIFHNPVTISEERLAKLLSISPAEAERNLKKLHELDVVIYSPKKDKPQLIFTTPRQKVERLSLDTTRLNALRETAENKLKAMINYTQHKHRCRTQLLLEYFGEVSYEECGICDICLEKHKKPRGDQEDKYHHQVEITVEDSLFTVEEIMERLNPGNKGLLLEVIRKMVDAGELEYDNQWRLKKK